MISKNSNTDELIAAIVREFTAMGDAILHLSETEINEIPFENSWTAAQVVRHVTKSAKGVSLAMDMPAEAAQRDPGEKIEQLRNSFLDFSVKMKSPEFVVPEDDPYQKDKLLKGFNEALQAVKNAAAGTPLDGLVKGLPFGEITKLELLHFVLYHTQRHLHQLHKVKEAIKNRRAPQQY